MAILKKIQLYIKQECTRGGNMIRACDRCEESTDDAYLITVCPVSTNGIVEHYFVCNDCADEIRAFIKMDDPDPCKYSRHLMKKLSEHEHRIAFLEARCALNKE